MVRKPPKPPGVETAPRFKKAKKQTGQSHGVVQHQLTDASRLSRDIPDSVKLAIASVVMTFSELEMSAEMFIWEVLKLSDDDGKLVTQIDTKDKLELAKKLSERYAIPLHSNPQSAAEAWSVIRKLIEARNKVAHGVWSMIDRSMPIAVSYRIPVEPGSVNSEHFPISRMTTIADSCSRLRRRFDEMCAIARSLPKTPSPKPPTLKPNLPEFPLPNDQ